MLEKLKAEVLLAYQELNKYGLNKYARGIVSAIDRESCINRYESSICTEF